MFWRTINAKIRFKQDQIGHQLDGRFRTEFHVLKIYVGYNHYLVGMIGRIMAVIMSHLLLKVFSIVMTVAMVSGFNRDQSLMPRGLF